MFPSMEVPDGYVAIKPDVAAPICKKALESIQQARGKKLRLEVEKLCDKANNSTMRRLSRWLGIGVKRHDVDELLQDRARLDALRDGCALIDEVGWALLTGWQCKESCEEVLASGPAEMVYLSINRWKLIQEWAR